MILSEIYCQRRGQYLHDFRPPLLVFCTSETQNHLYQTHHYGYTGGKSLQHVRVIPGEMVQAGIFNILPLSVDHFEGAVIYVIEFNLSRPHKIIIGWDTTTLPLAYIEQLYRPSLALFEATTWHSMAQDTGHSSLEDLVKTGFLERLELGYQPAQERYGAYLVHYSGREDPWGMLTDQDLKEKFDHTFPSLSNVVRVAERGQQWIFD